VDDIAGTLTRLQALVGRRPWPQADLEAAKARLRVPPIHGDGLSPLLAVQAMREVLPGEAILTCDV
jgi:hypothetical protein